MTRDRDPAIESLFRSTNQEIADEAFTDRVMSQVDNRRRRTIALWVGAGLVLAVCAWFLILILQDAVFLLTQILPSTLVDLENRWVAGFLSPLNSVTGLSGIAVLGVWLAFRKIFY